MNEKIRNLLTVTLWQTILMTAVFAVLFAVKYFSPQTIEKISAVWTKNTDFERAFTFVSNLFGELIPF